MLVLKQNGGVQFFIIKEGMITSVKTEMDKWDNIVGIAGVCAGLRNDGSVLRRGKQSPIWHDIRQITGGDSFILGISRDGTVRWQILNENEDQPWLREVEKWENLQMICAARGSIAGLRADGRAYYAERPKNNTGEEADYLAFRKTEIESWNDLIKVFTDGGSVVGLKNDGTVFVNNGRALNQRTQSSNLELANSLHDIVDCTHVGGAGLVALDRWGKIHCINDGAEFINRQYQKACAGQKARAKDVTGEPEVL